MLYPLQYSLIYIIIFKVQYSSLLFLFLAENSMTLILSYPKLMLS